MMSYFLAATALPWQQGFCASQHASPAAQQSTSAVTVVVAFAQQAETGSQHSSCDAQQSLIDATQLVAFAEHVAADSHELEDISQPLSGHLPFMTLLIE
jgi:hypothetical protein